MKIAITGSHGFIGSALVKALEAKGYQVIRVKRQGPRFGALDELAAQLQGAEAVVHLAGAGISDRRWSAAYKREILESRVEGTRALAEAAAKLDPKPGVFISGSAVGYYGPRGTEALDEKAAPGTDFLAKVCHNWEEAAEPARKAGIRCAVLRTGLVLGRQGGALKKMLLPFQLGLGGIIGDGKQVYSWITLEDWIGALIHILESKNASGPYNLSAPGACSNLEFTKALGKALRRPTLFPMPGFAAKLAFGEMAQALLLSGQNVKPAKLLAEGYRFKAEKIEEAFKQVFAA